VLCVVTYMMLILVHMLALDTVATGVHAWAALTARSAATRQQLTCERDMDNFTEGL
jgi:hypothetical protein